MQPPSIEQALALCRSIDVDLASGEVVAVHCRAGLGRTGTVLAAYRLWRGRGALSALQALEDVRRIEPGWVQSVSQVKFLEEFALVVANRAAGDPAANDPDAARDDAAAVS
jgi:atypical dual specificity phosphatase